MDKPEIMIGMVANLWTRQMTFKNKGDIELGHKHQFDHLTLLASGALKVEIEGNITEFKAPFMIFISKDKTRMETLEGITITRMDKKVVWILMPKDKMYMEQPFDPSKAVASSEKVSGEIERKLIGQEIIDGKMTNKYQIVYNQNGKRETIFQWLAVGLKIPVKTAAGDNSWIMEYKNIKTGKQSDALFEVPADYQKFSYQRPSVKDILKGLVR